MPTFEEGDRRIDLPEGLTPEEERAVVMALERYFVQESPKPSPWVLQSRIDNVGIGRLQARKYARDPWESPRGAHVRFGVAPVHGRSDVR
jgi:hypothetical protein